MSSELQVAIDRTEKERDADIDGYQGNQPPAQQLQWRMMNLELAILILTKSLENRR